MLFRHAPDRKGERPIGHLRVFQGDLYADGYAGLDRLYGERITQHALAASIRLTSSQLESPFFQFRAIIIASR